MTDVFAFGDIPGDADTGVRISVKDDTCCVRRDYQKVNTEYDFKNENTYELKEKKKVIVAHPSDSAKFKHSYKAELRNGRRKWVHRVRIHDEAGNPIKTVNTRYG